MESEFRKDFEQCIEKFKKNPDDPELRQTIIDIFSTQLLNDFQTKTLSEASRYAPRLKSSLNKQTRIASDIALKMYPTDVSDRQKRVYSYMQYQRVIAGLNQIKKAKIEAERLAKEKAEKEQRELRLVSAVCTMRKRPVSKAVAEPTPMPVEVPELEKFTPFFQYLTEGGEFDEECKEFQSGACYQDGRIDLCKQVVGPPHISHLLKSIKDNPHVTHFLLGNNIIGPDGGKAIGEFIQNPGRQCHIKTWYLAGNCIDANGIQSIAKALESDRDCDALWLKRNPLMLEGIGYIAEMLRVNQGIEILDLHNTGVFDAGTQILFEALKANRTLKILYLDGNGLTDKAGEYIADYFDYLVENNLEGIHSLFVSINRLGDSGAEAIAKSVKNYKFLQRLNVGSNGITESGTKALCEALVDHTNLIEFNLGFYKSTWDMGEICNAMRDPGVPHIVNFIKNNRGLQILDIGFNYISLDGICQIIDALEQNTDIVYFYYGQYQTSIPESVKDRVNAVLTRNIQSRYGTTIKTFREKNLRFLRHTEKIQFIDSIYRNRM
jgi:hypothetical protein